MKIHRTEFFARYRGDRGFSDRVDQALMLKVAVAVGAMTIDGDFVEIDGLDNPGLLAPVEEVGGYHPREFYGLNLEQIRKKLGGDEAAVAQVASMLNLAPEEAAAPVVAQPSGVEVPPALFNTNTAALPPVEIDDEDPDDDDEGDDDRSGLAAFRAAKANGEGDTPPATPPTDTAPTGEGNPPADPPVVGAVVDTRTPAQKAADTREANRLAKLAEDEAKKASNPTT